MHKEIKKVLVEHGYPDYSILSNAQKTRILVYENDEVVKDVSLDTEGLSEEKVIAAIA